MLFNKTKSHDKDGGTTSYQEVAAGDAAIPGGPTGIDKIEEIGQYALDSNSNNNLAGLRAQILANAEALYARTNLLVVTESVRIDSAPNFVHVVAMVITQEKIAVGNDHIVKIKLKGRPGETREAALSFLLAHLENGIHNLLWSTPTEEPQRYQYNPAT